MSTQMSRRSFMRYSALAAGTGLLAACTVQPAGMATPAGVATSAAALTIPGSQDWCRQIWPPTSA